MHALQEISNQKRVVLTEIIDSVKLYMHEIGVTVPFFLAGGSVCSVIFTDVKSAKELPPAIDFDIWFYDIDAYNSVKDSINKDNIKPDNLVFSSAPAETDNAITVELDNRPIQFIKLRTGGISDILNGFDMNSSMAAFSSEYKLVLDPSFSQNVKINYDHFCGTTFSRYRRYIKTKNITDVDNIEIKKLTKFCVENWNKSYKGMYSNGIDTLITGARILNNILAYHVELGQYINDHIELALPLAEKAELYTSVSALVEDMLVTGTSVEYQLGQLVYINSILADKTNISALIGHSRQSLLRTKAMIDIKTVMNKYPEYFL